MLDFFYEILFFRSNFDANLFLKPFFSQTNKTFLHTLFQYSIPLNIQWTLHRVLPIKEYEFPTLTLDATKANRYWNTFEICATHTLLVPFSLESDSSEIQLWMKDCLVQTNENFIKIFQLTEDGLSQNLTIVTKALLCIFRSVFDCFELFLVLFLSYGYNKSLIKWLDFAKVNKSNCN